MINVDIDGSELMWTILIVCFICGGGLWAYLEKRQDIEMAKAGLEQRVVNTKDSKDRIAYHDIIWVRPNSDTNQMVKPLESK